MNPIITLMYLQLILNKIKEKCEDGKCVPAPAKK
jgi:hypothetical protein